MVADIDTSRDSVYGAGVRDMTPTTRAALREVLTHGELPRAEIARRLDLSRASLTRITQTLVGAGLLNEGETRLLAATGRPSEMLSLRRDALYFVGIKLTGDAMYAVVADLAATIVASVQQPLTSRSVESVIDAIAVAVSEFALRFPITSIGIALAGRIQAEKHVEYSGFLGWADVPLATLVMSATGLPCTVENDVQALTATEHWFGAGAGLDNMALITVGVGIGCGLVVNGRLLDGAHSRPGLVSHLIVDDDGPLCSRGHRGCATCYLISDAIVEASGLPDASYDTVVEAARGGDAGALQAFRRAGRALGVIAATVANLVDPQKIVLTGDGIPIVEFARAEIDLAIASGLDPEASPVALDVRVWDFSEWARAAAGIAITALIR